MAGPFRVMVLDRDRIAGKLEHLGIGDAEPPTLRVRDRHVLGAVAALGVDHAHLLASQRATQNSPMARPKRRLVHVELVGIDGALNDVLAEPIDAGDEHDITEAGFGIQRESDAAGGAIRPHHLHHADRERDLEVVESLVGAIGDRAVGEDGCKAASAGFEQIVGATDI